MKRRNKTIITASLTAFLGLSVAVGSTYSLFSSEDSVETTITTGKVEWTATATNLKLFSGKWDTSLEKYVDENRTASGTFTNGGTAKVVGTTLLIDKITPMDRVEYDLVFKNNSSVGSQYRYVYEILEDTGLFSGLEVTFDDVAYDGIKTQTDWTAAAAGTGDKTVHVVAKMPETASNRYQNKSCKLSYKVEAVQGNAHTFNGEAYLVRGGIKTEYETFKAALQSGRPGDTVLLNKSVKDLGAYGPVTDGVTLDGNGYSISGDSRVWLRDDTVYTIKNTKFFNIYKEGASPKLSAFWSDHENWKGTLNIDSCVFDSIQYDAIQVTPGANAKISITNTKFLNSLGLPQQRFIHIEGSTTENVKININGCTFLHSETLAQECVGIYPINPATLEENVDCTGNFVDKAFHTEVLDHESGWQGGHDYKVFLPFGSLNGYQPSYAMFDGRYDTYYTDSLDEAFSFADEGYTIVLDGEELRKVSDGWAVNVKDANKYYIYNALGFNGLRTMVNNKETNNNTVVTLLNDINLENNNFTPIGYGHGTGLDPNLIRCFYGTFDGKNHVISNLKIDNKEKDVTPYGCGLFGFAHGTIKNFTLENVDILNQSCIGAVVASMYTGEVANVNVKGNIKLLSVDSSATGWNFGGIVGVSHGGVYIHDCSVVGDNGSKISGNRACGGIIGFNRCDIMDVGRPEVRTIENCLVKNISVEAYLNNQFGQAAGGICGTAQADMHILNNSLVDVTVHNGGAVTGCCNPSSDVIIPTIKGNTGNVTLTADQTISDELVGYAYTNGKAISYVKEGNTISIN